MRAVFQCFRVNRGNKLGADEADVNGRFHGAREQQSYDEMMN